MRTKGLGQLVGIVLGLALVGCRVGEPLDPATLEAQLAIASSFGTGSSVAVKNGWLGDFSDDNLTAVVIEALEHNPDLETAAAQVEIAAGYARQADAQLKPAVDLGASGYQGGGTTSTASAGASLDLTWEIDIWGRLRSQAAEAENQLIAAELTYAYARQSLAAQIAKSWFLCVETHLQKTAAEEAVALYEKTLQIVQAQFQQQAVARQNVDLAEADLASAKEALREATGADQQARRALELLLGRYPSAEITVAEDFAAIPTEIPAGVPSELLERRADIVAAERRVAAAFESVRVAKAAKLPRIALTASAGATTAALQGVSNPANAFWTVGANMLAPLFDGGRLQAEEDIATAEQKAAVAGYRKAALQAFADVENGLANERLLRERETFLQTALEKNRSALEIGRKQFEAGAIDLLSVLQMQRRVLNARIAFINIRSRRVTQRVNLHLSLGGNFESANE